MKHFKFPQSFIPVSIFVSLIVFIKLFELTSGLSLSFLGLYPQRWQGLVGIITAPFLHGSIQHLLSNTFPLLFLAPLVFELYPRLAWALVRWLFLATGFWTWCFARESYHIGASGLVYGLAAFLFFAGIWRGKRSDWAISLLILLFYGTLLLGLIPQENNISWESHLSGFLAGASFAYFSKKWDYAHPDSLSYSTENLQKEEIPPIMLTHIYYQKTATSEPKTLKTY